MCENEWILNGIIRVRLIKLHEFYSVGLMWNVLKSTLIAQPAGDIECRGVRA